MSSGQWIKVIAFATALYILWQIRQVLLLAFMAVVFATALNWLVRQLRRFHIKRGFAVLLVLLSLALLFSIIIVGVAPAFIDQFQQLIDLVPLGIDRLRTWFNQLQILFADSWLVNIFGSLERLAQVPQMLRGQIVAQFFAFFSGTLNIILSSLLVIILMIMLLVNPLQYRRALILLFPASLRSRVDDLLNQCDSALAGWSVGLLFNMAVIALFSGLGLWILGIPLALANALLAGLLTFIPNIGPTLSVIPPMAIALLDSPWKALAVLVLYILIQQLETNVLTPLVMQKQVSLLPAVTLLSQVIFGTCFGFLGLFLALPLVVVGQVVLREVIIHDILDHR